MKIHIRTHNELVEGGRGVRWANKVLGIQCNYMEMDTILLWVVQYIAPNGYSTTEGIAD